MENVENQNPYAALSSAPANQPDDKPVGRSNECLWLGILSATGFAVAYLLFFYADNFSMGIAATASIFGMLLCFIAGGAGIAGFAIGGIEAIAQFSSNSIFGQKKTVFAGIALSLTGPAILIARCTYWILQLYR